MEASFVIILLVHISASCKSSTAEGFKFRDEEARDLPVPSPVKDQTSRQLKLEEVSADNFFEKEVDQVKREVDIRDGKVLTPSRKVKFEESVQNEAPQERVSKKITASSKVAEPEAGKI